MNTRFFGAYSAMGYTLVTLAAANPEPIPEFAFQILDNYCLSCHDDVEFKGEINLDSDTIAWEEEASQELWKRVIKMIDSGEMPPKKKKQPAGGERKELIDWLDAKLSKHQPIGGSELRRLNRREYELSIRDLFGIDFKLPNGFPQDNVAHGFDNQAKALTLSGALMESYSSVATDLAEKLFPPPIKTIPISTNKIPAKDFTYAYSSGLLVEGSMRLVSSSEPLAHSATWPTHYEAPATGTYLLTIDLSSLNPQPGEPVLADIYAVVATEASQENIQDLRKIAKVEITESRGQRFEMEVILEKGETIAFHYPTAVIKEDTEKIKTYLLSLFEREPAIAAAYKKVDGPVARGRSGLDHLYELIQAGDLPAPPEGEELDNLISKISRDKRIITETFSYKLFEEGPALEIRHLTLTGPLTLTASKADLYWKERAAYLLGKQNGKEEASDVRAFLRRFLSHVFRRPVKDDLLEEYVDMVLHEKEAGGRVESGYHMALRTALTSPYFLYRGFNEGLLDGYDIANRLSFFLTSAPPDRQLMKAAKDGSLLEPGILAKHSRRLIASSKFNAFVESFLGQWLDLDELESLVPDATLFHTPRDFNYTDAEKDAYIREAHMVFREILNENRPIEDFIDPDFTYTTGAVGRFIYNLPQFEKSKKNENSEMVRVSFERGGKFGGVLGMAGVMTATANGVDTEPVHRGAWILENILGNPAPPPPGSVPALTPDTNKATTPREMLAAHMSEESCAGCHKKIDPLGFVLESFDPVGRWRSEYPPPRNADKKSKAPGLPVETNGQLTDGTILNDVTDLKRYLRSDIVPFAECISEKLLVYGTGRAMNYSDQKLIRKIVEEIRQDGGGFQDLFIALINSESFRTR